MRPQDQPGGQLQPQNETSTNPHSEIVFPFYKGYFKLGVEYKSNRNICTLESEGDRKHTIASLNLSSFITYDASNSMTVI